MLKIYNRKGGSFMKSFFSKSPYVDKEDNSILNDIAKTRYALETAYAGFENATDPDLIDCYIYSDRQRSRRESGGRRPRVREQSCTDPPRRENGRFPPGCRECMSED